MTKKIRPREMAAPPKTCSAVPSDPPMLFLLIGSSTSLRISARSALRPDDEELAALGADENLSVRHHRRRLLRRAERLRPELLAGLDVVRLQPRSVFNLIHARPVDERRREAELLAEMRPLRRFDVAGLRAVDRGDHAHFVAGEVFVAVRDDDGVAADDDASVNGALGGDEAPDFFAGLHLDGVNAAIAKTNDQQPRPVDGRDVRRSVSSVVRPTARVRRRRRCRRFAC